MVLVGRAGKPEDVAGPAFFLCSEDSRYVTGQVLLVDGDPLSNLAVLRDPLGAPVRAWEGLRSAGVTHVVVHRAAYPEQDGESVITWLRGHGGRVVATSGTDELVALPR